MAADPHPNNGTTTSPFALPAMADAYPLDSAERRTVDQLLDEFQREHANGDEAVARAGLTPGPEPR
jgi:hypothetical protein